MTQRQDPEGSSGAVPSDDELVAAWDALRRGERSERVRGTARDHTAPDGLVLRALALLAEDARHAAAVPDVEDAADDDLVERLLARSSVVGALAGAAVPPPHGTADRGVAPPRLVVAGGRATGTGRRGPDADAPRLAALPGLGSPHTDVPRAPAVDGEVAEVVPLAPRRSRLRRWQAVVASAAALLLTVGVGDALLDGRLLPVGTPAVLGRGGDDAIRDGGGASADVGDAPAVDDDAAGDEHDGPEGPDVGPSAPTQAPTGPSPTPGSAIPGAPTASPRTPAGSSDGSAAPGIGPPAVDEPGADPPGADQPGADQPGVDEPGDDQPGDEQPGTEEGTSAPTPEDPAEPPEPGPGDEPGPSEPPGPGPGEPTSPPGTPNPTTPPPDPDPTDPGPVTPTPTPPPVSVTVVARDDAAVTDEGRPVAIPVGDNDEVEGGEPGLVVNVAPAAGTVERVGAGLVRYTPAAGYAGNDVFGYSLCVGTVCDEATVTVQVRAVASPPTAAADARSVATGGTVLVDVLRNDDDPDGDLDPSSLAVTSAPAVGAAAVEGGQVRYSAGTTPGTVAVGYQVCDATGRCASSRVVVDVLAPEPVDPGETP